MDSQTAKNLTQNTTLTKSMTSELLKSSGEEGNDTAPLAKEPWDSSANRPVSEPPETYWKNTGYLGETLEFSSRDYAAETADLALTDRQLLADICEVLAVSDEIDATDVTVAVHDGVVNLAGSLLDQQMKHATETAIYAVPGVVQIQSEISVRH